MALIIWPLENVRKVIGALRIPADTKSIEVYVYENGISPDKYAVFNFDVPPVETMTLEKYAASLN